MLSATQKEIGRVTEYMLSQAPDLTVEFKGKILGRLSRGP